MLVRKEPVFNFLPPARDGTELVTVRILVLVFALAILYLRMPGSFTHPQLWGEDNDFLYVSRAHGWSSLSTVIAGWLATIQFLVAILASYFSPAAAPAIYHYAAFVLTLLVVWMVTSPRLDMPYKPLLGIAVVIVPMGYEELGTLTNIQWILPIGAFALLFTRASKSSLVLAAEAFFAVLVALSGAFCIFLSPLFLWRLVAERDAVKRQRFMLLPIIMCAGAVTQAVVLLQHPSVLNLVAPTPYPWTVWVNLPFTQFMTTFGPSASAMFKGPAGAAIGLVLLGSAVALACLRPYRTQKLFMLFFALAIAVSGMFKFRAALERYFYAGAVFALWFICCLSSARYLRTALATLVVAIELMLLPVVANTPRFAEDQEWRVWASYFPSGLPVIIPTTPAGFYLSLPASAGGPLAQFAPWKGRKISEVAGPIDASSCTGSMAPVASAGMIYLQPLREEREMWITKGSAWDAARNRPVELVVLVDAGDRVIGFGFPGFKAEAGAPSGSQWISIFYAHPGTTIRAYGIVDHGQRLCALANPRSFPLNVQPLASEKFVGGEELLPGKTISQRFKPAARLEEISTAFVTWGRTPSDYTVDWKIIARCKGQELVLGSGTIASGAMRDWKKFSLPLATVPVDVPDEIEVRFSSNAPAAPVGLPLYQPMANSDVPAADLNGMPLASGGQLGLSVAYVR
jgi:hypothetical protein